MRETNATKLIAITIGVARMLAAVLTIAFGAVACGFSGVLGHGVFARITMFWHRTMLRIFGATPVLRGVALVPGALVVCNHVSWMDILVLGANWRVVFLGNSEILRWPVLGWVIKRVGTLFIKRGSGAKKALRDIAGELRQGRDVVLFPEGATTDGHSVIRFQPRLMQAAINVGAPLQPAALRYLDASGARVVRHSFIGDISLVGILGTRGNSGDTIRNSGDTIRNYLATAFGPGLPGRSDFPHRCSSLSTKQSEPKGRPVLE